MSDFKFIEVKQSVMKVIPICAKTDEGIGEWADWPRQQTLDWIS